MKEMRGSSICRALHVRGQNATKPHHAWLSRRRDAWRTCVRDASRLVCCCTTIIWRIASHALLRPFEYVILPLPQEFLR